MLTARLVLALSLALATPLAAQRTAKKPITQDVYDLWRVIHGATLSPDGRWVAYTLSPVVGDGEVIVRAIGGTTEHRASRGFTGRPQLQPSADSGFTPAPARFTEDGRFVIFLAYAPRAEYERARRAGPKSDPPPASLGILSTADGRVTLVPRVKSFKLAEDAGRYVAYLLESDSARADTARRDTVVAPAAAAVPGGEARPIAADTGGKRKPKKDVGSMLVLRELANGQEVRVPDVLGYVLDDDGRWLAYAVSSRAGDEDGVYVRSLTDGTVTPLLTGEGSYKQLAIDKRGTQVAFVSDRDERSRERPRHALYHATLSGAAAARPVVRPAALGEDYIVSDRTPVTFTREGGTIVFGVAPAPLDSIPADSLADKAVFDLWHYRDLRLQPQQRVEASRDRTRAYTAVYQLDPGTFVRLGNDTLLQVTVGDHGRVALAQTNVPYSISAMWGEGGQDIYVLDALSGARRLVAERVRFGATLSPGGGFVIYFQEGRWLAHQVATGRTADLTGALDGVRFDQETWDTPSTPAPWGVGGWTIGDRSVLVYDRFDVWELDPTGERPPRIVTDSVGRRQQLVFRVVDLEPDERFLDPARPLLLRAFDSETKASGFWRDRLDVTRPPQRIVMADRRFGVPAKAENAEAFVVTQSTYRDFPDLWAGPSLDRLRRISEANPQQAEYPWGTVELVRWYSGDGIRLTGLLYKPDGFDAGRKYPMVVYFYEQLSDNLHQYHAPAGRNNINPTVYTSLGYLVFLPDVSYEEGYPGPSAVKSIVPGVASLIEKGYVDPARIGIAGQSWGGYQTAYIITQTNMFAAAVPNATVANMTSAYGGIRWQSGLARAFQYERTQSRIGGSLWEYPMRYLENSPLFHADRIETPVLMMHNDNDGAVPWYQGIELFVALRRLGKEVYLINYNGDAHNPTKRANQKDIDLRMQQFFAHHLKGEPAPEWMRRGIPFLEKGRDQIATPPREERQPEPVTTGEATRSP